MTRFGKYPLVRKLASGGMGEVFLTRSEGAGGFEKTLVLKRILPHLAENKEFLDLFLDEARIAARLNHANVVQIFELGDVDGAWYLLMEYVAGKDLRQVGQTLIHKRKKLPLGLACRIAADAAAGLDYAHRARDPQGRPMQIVHRDVSPHNVLLSFDGAVKLIDFGVARAVGRLQQDTEAGMLRGKYPYMSPEQVTSGALDGRSDQFSLGVVLWELLAGQRLFKAESDALTLQRVAECNLVPPSRKEEALPPDLVAVVMKALAKDPAQRFPDLGAFRLELEELITAHQWQASSAHLSAFLRALYPEGVDDETAQTEPLQTKSSRPSAKSKSKSKTKSRPKAAAPEATVSEHAVKLLRALAELPPQGARVAAPMTSFVGRTTELETLRRLVAREKLLTLLGPGGAGKTRLATQLALEAPAASFADLTDATDLDGLCAAVARALGANLASGKTAEDAVEQLGRALAARDPAPMLVLDNFEQLTAYAPDTVGRWRALAPNVTFLVTTREATKLPGETVWEVPPLAEGVELFLERARSARPGWTPSDAEVKAVGEIVQQLDGMPLAIELAAARMAMLSPAQLVQRLPRRFDLLSGARTDVSARQATLRGAIDWSWELLQGHEQLALAQLAVFRGGFTIEAAEAVVSLAAFPSAPWALDVVQALRDKSLVRTWEAAGFPGEMRFGFFESIRAYALEKLKTLGPTAEAEAQARHAAWYLVAAKGWLAGLESRQATAVLDRLQVERENLLAVVQHAPKPQALEAALAVDPLLALRGPFIGHLPMLDEVLQFPHPPAAMARGLLARGLARQGRSRFADSIEDFEAALALKPEPRLAGRLYTYVGGSLRQMGKMDESRARFEQALELVRRAGDRWFEGRVLGQLGGLLQEMGAIDAAFKLYERALALHREVGDRRFEGIVLSNLGSYFQERLMLAEARTYFEQALAIHREVGNRRSEGIVLSNLASLVRAEGALPAARTLLERALAVHREVGNARFEGIVLNNLGTTALEEKAWLEAESELTRALAVFEQVGDRRYQGLCASALGAARAAQGRMKEAEAAFAQADTLLGSVIDAHAHAVIAVYRGYLDLTRGDRSRAKERLSSVEKEEAGSEQVRTAVRALRAAL